MGSKANAGVSSSITDFRANARPSNSTLLDEEFPPFKGSSQGKRKTKELDEASKKLDSN